MTSTFISIPSRRLIATLLATIVLLFQSNRVLSLDQPIVSKEHNRSHHQPRRLKPFDDVSYYLQQQYEEGIARPQFTFVGEMIGGSREEEQESGEVEYFEIDVVEANPSVTAQTTFSVHGGPSMPVGESNVKLFVADGHRNGGNGNLALISVDMSTGELVGIAQKKGQPMFKVQQSPSQNEGRSTATQQEEFVPPKWECGVTPDLTVNSISKKVRGTGEGVGGVTIVEDASSMFGGRRLKGLQTAHDGIHKHHHDHSHGHDDELGSHSHFHSEERALRGHDNIHNHEFNSNDILSEIMSTIGDLAAVKNTKRRKLYATDSFPQLYTYQVDLYIEIDDVFLANNDDDMDMAIEYVNKIVTYASSIYEREIDSHLHVAHVAVTNLYDDFDDSADALDLMFDTYAGDEWHYQEGFGVDLHHALLGRDMGGGIAYVETICRPDGGFGVSTGVEGNANLEGVYFWDVYVFLHEIGHNFGSFHTHDLEGYSPPVDECGIFELGNYKCDVELPLEGSATIMSYCHLCDGDLQNIALTFGGSWYEDNRNNLDNWENDPNLAGTVSYEPRRVPKVMWEHVSSQTCVEPNFEVPTVVCSNDGDCFDGNSCTLDTCDLDTNECVNTLSGSCCGNNVCEPNEHDCDDCGPFTLETPECTSCFIPNGMMFDVSAEVDIILESLEFRLYDGSHSVTVYTANGTYFDKYTSPSAWSQVSVHSVVIPGSGYVQSVFPSPIELAEGSVQTFYVASSGFVLAGDLSENPLASDGYLQILNPGRGVVAQHFGAGEVGYSWNGHMTYSVQVPDSPTLSPSISSAPSSAAPTSSPEASPTSNPTASPTKSPSEPTKSPTTNPTSSPTGAPTASPISQPTKNPTSLPTISPALAPTSSPTSSPSPAPTSSPAQPTTSSTPNPTKSPTLSPSKNPSVSPSTSPTENPTASPTAATSPPTTAQPTASPTKNPTLSPSTSPTNKPTTSPTKNPTMSPSGSPTTPPTTAPSASPTMSPTGHPTASPNASPSQSPSKPTPVDPQWYMDWQTLICKQDCVGAEPCGGPRLFWNDPYTTQEECCNDTLHPSPDLEAKCLAWPENNLFGG